MPVATGLAYAAMAPIAVRRLVARAARDRAPDAAPWPAVSILKPVYGLEKNLERNLRSALDLDYPQFQVVLAVQRLDDPALPLLRALAEEYGPGRATLVVNDSEPVFNGKVQNLIGAIGHARHEILVISDSDVRLEPGYLRRLAAPLADPSVGAACTLFRGVEAESWYEKLEQLSINGEFMVNVMFAEASGGKEFCPGCSLAVRRSVLVEIGGLEPLREYLVEDYELGRRVRALGYRVAVVPAFVDVTIDLARPRQWWDHQVYWEQNTRWVNPLGFALTIFIQPLPFALLFAALRGFDLAGLAVLALVVAVRLATRAAALTPTGDRATRAMLSWLPLRDLVGFGAWVAALAKRTFVWRDLTFELREGGRIVPRESSASG